VSGKMKKRKLLLVEARPDPARCFCSGMELITSTNQMACCPHFLDMYSFLPTKPCPISVSGLRKVAPLLPKYWPASAGTIWII
jgi:hypothetical protein